jgi:CRP/FNR family transcriptional regulator
MALNDGPPVLESCVNCKSRGENAFCNLPPDALRWLDQISFAFPYPERAVLFSENEPCRGVFILCSGRAKLTAASRAGKTIMLRVAEAGEVLGMSSVLSGRTYEVTVEIVSAALVRFVKRDDFVQFLRAFPENSLHALRTLGQEYEKALDNLRTLAWLSTATARVAQLLLHLASNGNQPKRGNGTRLLLTQEQIAQMTATTRETVTRLLVQLRKDRIITLRGSDLVIRDRAALERMAS